MSTNSLNAVARTVVIVPSTDSEYAIPGDMTAEQVKASYASTISGLSSMTHEEVYENQPGFGRVRILTFKPRTGTKGNGLVARTVVIVPSTDSEYAIPGDMTAEQVKASYASTISGLSSMTHEEVYENQPGFGRVRILTFKPRTGTKGADFIAAFLARAV